MKKDDRNFLVVLFLSIITWVILSLCACSPKPFSAAWHFQKGFKKDPDFFVFDSTVSVNKIETPKASLIFDCVEGLKKDFKLPLVISETRTDTIKVEVEVDSSGNARIGVDCPDIKEKIIKVSIPTPVYIHPSFMQKLEWIGGGVLALAFLIGAVLLIKFIFNKKNKT